MSKARFNSSVRVLLLLAFAKNVLVLESNARLQRGGASVQAVLDAQSAQKEQQGWLKENLQTHFARKLLRMVDKIAKFVLPGDGKSEHAFPRLAGSHLSAVSLRLD